MKFVRLMILNNCYSRGIFIVQIWGNVLKWGFHISKTTYKFRRFLCIIYYF